ncbi:tRNA lysidine(34) synthetase TilS [bacterium]|nr:tRNA lysidine(34) synthetase TilS [bacterium]
MNFIEDKVRRFINEHSLYPAGSSILLAVSGGVDSIVLLHLMNNLRKPLELSLGIAHFNHRLRGTESERDWNFTEELSKKYKLPFYSGEGNFNRDLAGLSIQMEARKQRYNFFNKIISQYNYSFLATGHNRNDNAETVLMALMRNYGLRGLAGLRPKNGIYTHPLLCLSREEIIKYAEENELKWVEDSSNQKPDYLRNRVRLQLMPVLEEIFPYGIEALCSISDEAWELSQTLEREAEIIWEQIHTITQNGQLILEIINKFPYFTILWKYILYRAVREIAPDYHPSPQAVEELYNLTFNTSGKTLRIGGIETLKDRGRLIFRSAQAVIPEIEQELRHKFVIGDIELTMTQVETLEIEITENPAVEYIDLDKTTGVLLVRRVKPGDIFQPIGFHGSVKVSDYLINKKISRFDKENILVITDAEKIIWLCGYRLDDRVKIDSGSKRIGRLQIRKTSEGIG